MAGPPSVCRTPGYTLKPSGEGGIQKSPYSLIQQPRRPTGVKTRVMWYGQGVKKGSTQSSNPGVVVSCQDPVLSWIGKNKLLVKGYQLSRGVGGRITKYSFCVPD